jgi:ankyrin repeat protein
MNHHQQQPPTKYVTSSSSSSNTPYNHSLSEMEPKFLAACAKGNAQAVRTLLEAGPHLFQVNQVLKDDSTLLHETVRRGDDDVARVLLDYGASLEARNGRHETPLHTAAKHNRSGLVRLLLQRNAQIDAREIQGQTPLHFAVHYDSPDAMAILIQHGADQNALDDKGRSCFYHAVQFASEATLQGLAQCVSLNRLDYYNLADENDALLYLLHILRRNNHRRTLKAMLLRFPHLVNAQGKDGDTILQKSCLAGNFDLAISLIRDHAANVEIKTRSDQRSLLHIACERRHVHPAFVILLIQRGAKIDDVEKTGLTALHVASSRGNVALVSLLLEWGADPTLKDYAGQNALTWACLYNQTDVAMRLISYMTPSSLNECCKDGLTPLLHDCRRHNLPLARELVKAGANLNTESNTRPAQRWSTTPLHLACERLRFERSDETEPIIDWLLDYKDVSPHAVDKHGYTPLHIACRTKNLFAVQKLLYCGTDVNVKNPHNGETPLHCLCSQGLHLESLSIARVLVENGARLNAKTKMEKTPLHFASDLSDDLELVAFLVDHGAEVGMTDLHRWTPLHFACRRRGALMVQCLLEKGAKNHLNAKNEDGDTPLLVASQRWGEEVMHLLLREGADPNMCNNLKKTVMHYAIGSGVQSAIRLLVQYGAQMDFVDHEGNTPFHMGTCSVNTTFFLLREFNAMSMLWNSRGVAGCWR